MHIAMSATAMSGSSASLVQHFIVVRAASSVGDIESLVCDLKIGDPAAKGFAAAELANRAVNTKYKAEIARHGAIPLLVAMLTASGGLGIHVETVIRCLGNLASADEANRAAIGAAGGIEPLVALLLHGTDSQKERAAMAVAHLSLHPANKLAVLDAGGVAPLQQLAQTGTPSQVERAARALRILEARDEDLWSAGLAMPPQGANLYSVN